MAARWQQLLSGLKRFSYNVRWKSTSERSFNPSPRYHGIVAATGLGAGLIFSSVVVGDVVHLHPPKYPWEHSGLFTALDHRSLRRGYQVYKEVCSACHGMKFLAFRNLVGVSHTEEEAKAFAEEYEYDGDPDDDGNPTTRPGKLSDYFPNPYPNEEAARAANSGTLPPDLSLIVLAREGAEDYIFSILTGYCDPPAGVNVGEGLAYNPYFPGGVIGMPQQLFNESIEYLDGTPATVSQMAKDVTTFLRWASEPEHDDRKRLGLKAIVVFAVLIGVSYYWKRQKWSYLKTMKVAYYER